MTMVQETPQPLDAPPMGLAARIVNVVLSPRIAYASVAARPRAAGVLMFVLIVMASAQFAFLSTEVGRNATLDQQISAMKSFGVNVTEEMVTRMESQLAYAPYTGAGSLVVFIPIVCAIMAGLLLAIFTAILGGGATFKQVYAVVAHSYVIGAIQQLFSLPIMYAQGQISSPTKLAVFFPNISDTGFAYYLLSAIDLFYLWSTINVAIGVAVLYKRRTGSVAAVLLGIYAVIAILIATVRAFAS